MSVTWAEQVEAMTPEQMVERYTALVDQQSKISRSINVLQKQLSRLRSDASETQKFIIAVSQAYSSVAGRPIVRTYDAETIHAAEATIKGLIALVCEPGNLPLDSPDVLAELGRFRDAVNNRRAAKVGSRKEGDS